MLDHSWIYMLECSQCKNIKDIQHLSRFCHWWWTLHWWWFIALGWSEVELHDVSLMNTDGISVFKSAFYCLGFCSTSLSFTINQLMWVGEMSHLNQFNHSVIIIDRIKFDIKYIILILKEISVLLWCSIDSKKRDTWFCL